MKIVYNTTNLVLSEGKTSVEKRMSVDPGDRIYVAAVALPKLGRIVKLGFTENGSEIHPEIPIDFYNGDTGNFEMKGLELSYKGGSELKIKATTSEALAAGEKVEIGVVFKIYQDDPSCN